MRPNTILAAAILMAFLMLSSSILDVHATAYYGRDNGEFDTCNSWGTCRLTSGAISAAMSLSASMTYSSSGKVSLQYNPDLDISKYEQTQNQYGYYYWFQTGVLSQSSNNCVIFTYQAYVPHDSNMTPSDSWFSNSENCYTVSGLFTYASGTGAEWQIQEATDSNKYVYDVCFDATGGGSSGGTTGSICIDPETNTLNSGDWYWLRSMLDLAGTGGTNAVFTGSTAGTFDYVGGGDIYGKPAPTILFGEDGNLYYSCFSGNGTTSMSQSFSLSSSTQC